MLVRRLIESAEALRTGLVNAVHESDNVLQAALAWAREVAEKSSSVSAQIGRKMLYKNSELAGPDAAHNAESRGQHLAGMSADAAEGVASFLDKRAPDFRGRLEGEMLVFFTKL